jgi:hypothetical protein
MRYDLALVIFPALLIAVIGIIGYLTSDAKWADDCRAAGGQPYIGAEGRQCPMKAQQ